MFMINTLERFSWIIFKPFEVRSRHTALAKDFKSLIAQGILPNVVNEIADIGAGSAAGSVALMDAYPDSSVTGIDSAENWQTGLYRRRKPPSYIKFVPDKIERFAVCNHAGFDLAVAAQISIYIPFSLIDPWVKKAKLYGSTMLTISGILREHGTLALSSPKKDRVRIEQVIDDNLRMDQLFREKYTFAGQDDHWVIWKDFNTNEYEAFARYPDAFLTPYAMTCSELDPYGFSSDN